MKKRFLLLALICFAFTSCLTFQSAETKENEIRVHIANDCAWELKGNIRTILGLPTFFTLSRSGKTYNLKKNKTYIITIQSRLDYGKKSVWVKTPDYDCTFSITWDSFDGKYHLYQR